MSIFADPIVWLGRRGCFPVVEPELPYRGNYPIIRALERLGPTHRSPLAWSWLSKTPRAHHAGSCICAVAGKANKTMKLINVEVAVAAVALILIITGPGPTLAQAPELRNAVRRT